MATAAASGEVVPVTYKLSQSGTVHKCVDNSQFYSKHGIIPVSDARSSMESSTSSSSSGLTVTKLTRIYDGSTKFPKLQECAHFHYDLVELGPLQVGLSKDDTGEEVAPSQFVLTVTSHGKTWNITRSYSNFRTFDKQLHRCIFDRKYSLLPELRNNEVTEDGLPAIRKLLSLYVHRFSSIAGNMINCGSVLSWLEMDNRGHRLLVTDDSAINTPAVAAGHVIRRYTGQAQDEISLEVGDIISLIDMPPNEETQWWRGKRGFEVGFFPAECVEVIGDTIPQSMTSKIPATPTKPVLRKRGKLISFLRTFFTSRPARSTLKRSGIVKERVFGCDLGEHLLNSAQEVPIVLRSCAETIEAHGIVDGIYRLSGVASNIQRLRSEFDEEQVPDLTADIYMQDIHSISSLLKMYFRELPNPLLTYQLYDKFASAVQQDEEARLLRLHDVIQMLPPPHYRTAEFLFRHLARVATSGRQTGMHCKNLAIVWAPNLMRSKELEQMCSTAALQGVGIQAIVTEVLIQYADVIFSDKLQLATTDPVTGSLRRQRPKSLAISTPTKLLSLEEAREQILLSTAASASAAGYIEVGGGPANLPPQYHTVIEVPKGKKYRGNHSKSPATGWRAIFSRKASTSSQGTSKTEKTQLVSPSGASTSSLRAARSADSLAAVNTALKNFLPTKDDIETLRKYCKIVVKQIVVSYFMPYNDQKKPIPVHEYKQQSVQKSQITCFGVIPHNPNTGPGSMEVARTMCEKYVPMQDGKPFKTVVFGDQGTVERLLQCRRVAGAAVQPNERMHGLEPAAQEFHKRGIYNQDTMNEFFKGSSSNQRGTLYNIKNKFNHRSVKNTVMSNFRHVENLLHFSADGLVALLGCQILGMKTIDETVDDPIDCDSLVDEIVNEIWHEPGNGAIPAVIHAAEVQDDELDIEACYQEICICRQVRDENVVHCTNWRCSRGKTFHMGCVGLQGKPIPHFFYCSKECEKESTQYCCGINKKDQMIACDCATVCPNREWFHLSCVGVEKVPKGKWYCSTACRKAKKGDPKEDHVLNYTRALAWRCIGDKVRKLAERHNDGKAMLSFWRIDGTDFWNKNHTKYLILAHRFIAAVNGAMGSRVAHDMLWNRTANFKGIQGGNLALDYVNELLNKEFKDNLKHSKGRYTDEHVLRCSQVVGQVTTQIEDVIHTDVVGTYQILGHSAPKHTDKDKEQIAKFVKVYSKCQLFKFKAGRVHKAFPQYRHNYGIARPPFLKARIKKHLQVMDKDFQIQEVHGIIH